TANLKTMLARFNFKRTDRVKVLESRQITIAARHLKSGRITPGQVFQVLKPFSYETIIFLRAVAGQTPISKLIDDFLFKYDSIKLMINGNDLQSLGIKSDRNMGRLLEN